MGAIDAKLTDSLMMELLEIIAVSGPTTVNGQLPFQWSTSNLTELRHAGHPLVFNFAPIHVQWFGYPLNTDRE